MSSDNDVSPWDRADIIITCLHALFRQWNILPDENVLPATYFYEVLNDILPEMLEELNTDLEADAQLIVFLTLIARLRMCSGYSLFPGWAKTEVETFVQDAPRVLGPSVPPPSKKRENEQQSFPAKRRRVASI